MRVTDISDSPLEESSEDVTPSQEETATPPRPDSPEEAVISGTPQQDSLEETSTSAQEDSSKQNAPPQKDSLEDTAVSNISPQEDSPSVKPDASSISPLSASSLGISL